MVTHSLNRLVCASLRVAGIAFFLAPIAQPSCAASLIFIRSAKSTPAEQNQVETAAKFYGLDLQTVVAGSPGYSAQLKAASQHQPVGIVIAGESLDVATRAALASINRDAHNGKMPTMIVGVDANTDPKQLSDWAGGAVIGCKALDNPTHQSYVFGHVDGVTGELSGIVTRPPAEASPLTLVFGPAGTVAQAIMSVDRNGQLTPTFAEASVGGAPVFVACAAPQDTNIVDGEDAVDAFVPVAPAMIFTRYAAGERGWHGLHHYANLTIDDPWLREPYGNVDYAGLLHEMEKHNFHTTIAFIPWNYDRSQAEVVSIFRANPDRFSIAVHGNNHDHKEFTDFRTKPLALQTTEMKQSLARMEKFTALTGIPYDDVMVFPHSIAPEKTLEALKTYNYTATVNSVNVPEDMKEPSDPFFYLRPVTLAFGDFASVTRYSIVGSTTVDFVAINQFLDNPLLFYGHTEDFAKGVDAFDGIADEVNQADAKTEWRGLGEILKNLYMVRQRDDSNYDVLAFTSNLCVENSSSREAQFFVQKEESGIPPIQGLFVDGKPFAYRLENGQLSFSMAIAAGASRCAAARYQNDLQLASIGTSRDSVVDYLLRMASDFRDIYLSKSPFGLALIRFYNNHGVTPKEAVLCIVVCLLICMFGAYTFIGQKRRL